MNFNNQNFDYLSLVQTLSTSLQAATSAFNIQSFQTSTQELLSGLQLSQAQAISALDAVTEQLSSIPLHPYQYLLWKYFDKDHKFKTIDEVPNYDDLPVRQSIEILNNKCDNYKQTIFHNITCCPDQQINSGFATLSGNEVIQDHDRQKQYLEFYEMVRQIPLDSINENNAITIAKKIAAEYIKIV
jgi:hypothetical protein